MWLHTRTSRHRHGQAVGATRCVGSDREQVASIPRNHCSHACNNYERKRKSKTLRQQVHKQVCTTKIKRTQTAENKKKRRCKERKHHIDGNCENVLKTKRDAQRTLNCYQGTLGSSFKIQQIPCLNWNFLDFLAILNEISACYAQYSFMPSSLPSLFQHVKQWNPAIHEIEI